MHHLHAYPDLRAMLRRLVFAALIGILAALAVAGFRHAMLLLEWLFLSNDTGSLVNAASSLSPLRRMLTPALGAVGFWIAYIVALGFGALCYLLRVRFLHGLTAEAVLGRVRR